MKITLLRIFIYLLSLLPLPVARLPGRVFGSLAWLANTRMAHTTRKNLRLCFPDLDEQALEELGRESLQQTFQTIMEAGAIWLWPPERTLGLIHTVTGQEKLAAAVQAGNGVLAIAPHLGNWELFGLYLNNCGCGQSWQLYQPPDSRALDSFILQARSRGGARMVPTDNKGVGELLKALRRGEIAGILPDQVPPDSGGEFAPFFGIPALTMTLFNRLQQKTGARVLVGVALRKGPGFEIQLTEPHPDVYAEDMPTALAGLNRSIEAVVKAAPAQYQWEYKRFKRQPAGQASRYDR
jgi:KDO2-lipid IV(A) lauroyltransferase